MKKIAIVFAGFILLASTSLNTAFCFYDDVLSTHKYYDSISSLYDLKRLPEEPDNAFRPDELLRTPDLYKFIIAYGQVTLSTNINLPFLDTENESEYAKYVQTALDLGILKATGLSPELGINKSVAKKKALETMFRALGVGVNYFFDKESFPFKDIKNNSETSALAQKAADLEVYEDTPDMFRMSKSITRGEAADYLYKIYANNNSGTSTIQVEYVPSYEDSTEITQSENFDTLAGVWEALKNNYLYKSSLDEDEMIYDAIDGLMDQVKDEYTVFQRPSKASTFLSSLDGEYDGIGASIDLIDGNIVIVSPLKDSPAEKIGLQANDIIIEVDGVNMKGKSVEEAAEKLRGTAGTKVKITILRDGKEYSYTITRAKIQNKSVYYEIKENDNKKSIAYIELVNFGTNTYSEFVNATQEILKEKIDGIILDMRSNPGGYMDSAINIIGLFTDKIEPAVKLRFADGSMLNYNTSGDGMLKDYKIVVLINKGSASASEIVAGALKDYKVAKLIGEKSFGKGTVQELATFKDGSLFKYTISKWLTPSGTDIGKVGITPDETVTNTGTEDLQLEEALKEF